MSKKVVNVIIFNSPIQDFGNFVIADFLHPSQLPNSEIIKVAILKLEDIKKHPSWPFKVAFCLHERLEGLGSVKVIADSVFEHFSEQNIKEEE